MTCKRYYLVTGEEGFIPLHHVARIDLNQSDHQQIQRGLVGGVWLSCYIFIHLVSRQVLSSNEVVIMCCRLNQAYASFLKRQSTKASSPW